jgi:DNA-binding beta-propeller fold protein YncE
MRLAAIVLALALLCVSGGNAPTRVTADGLTPGGDGRLVKTEPLYEVYGPNTCMIPAAYQQAALREMRARGSRVAGVLNTVTSPVRRVRDPFPAFAAVSVDTKRDEVVLTDENLFQVLVYDRTESTAADARASKPKRAITGEKTEIEFQSGVHVDPASGEIYAANNDTRDKLVVFGAGATGDVAPVRTVETPHGTFGVAVDHEHGEILLTVQHDSAIIVFGKQANGDAVPLRSVQGNRTGLADPHGIAIDPRQDVMYVANYGSTHLVDGSLEPRTGVPGAGRGRDKAHWPFGREYSVPGSGTINAPSIVVHRRTAAGNAEPLRLISGSKTQLNWPTGLAFDPERRELFVANDMGPSILVFDANAEGNAAPKRVLKGPRTGLANPTGVFVDTVHRELWVANFGGHSATVYDVDADGNTAPKRAIRSAPPDAPSLMIGNPGAVAFDSKREQLLVPN